MRIEKILETLAWTYIWNPALPIMLIVVGLYLTIRTKFSNLDDSAPSGGIP